MIFHGQAQRFCGIARVRGIHYAANDRNTLYPRLQAGLNPGMIYASQRDKVAIALGRADFFQRGQADGIQDARL